MWKFLSRNSAELSVQDENLCRILHMEMFGNKHQKRYCQYYFFQQCFLNLVATKAHSPLDMNLGFKRYFFSLILVLLLLIELELSSHSQINQYNFKSVPKEQFQKLNSANKSISYINLWFSYPLQLLSVTRFPNNILVKNSPPCVNG